MSVPYVERQCTRCGVVTSGSRITHCVCCDTPLEVAPKSPALAALDILQAHIDEARRWGKERESWETAYRRTQAAIEREHALEADNARLRALLRAADVRLDEWESECPWCLNRGQHRGSCPAFNTDGSVR